MKHEKYRVRPGLSVTSKDLYRRFKNNTLELSTHSDDSYSMDVEVQKFNKMSKTEQLNSLAETYDTINSLKSKMQNV